VYQLIKTLFNEKGFRIIESSEEFNVTGHEADNHFFAINSSARKEYYLVVFLKNIDGLQLLNLIKGDYTRNCYNNIKINSLYEKEMDKNTSLIFCLESDMFKENTSNEEEKTKLDLLKKVIYEVEEDPYFFKKYVLSYFVDQLDEIKTGIITTKSEGKSITDYLQSRLNNTELFKRYKENPVSTLEYDLLSKLFIKLPFLKLTNLDMDLLVNLKIKISAELLERDIVMDEDFITHLSCLDVSNFGLKDIDDLLDKLGEYNG
jgi:hypothetical protein